MPKPSVYLEAFISEAYLISREVRDMALCIVSIEHTKEETVEAIERECERLNVKVELHDNTKNSIHAIIYREDIHLEAYKYVTTYLSKFDENGHLMHYFLGRLLGYGNHAVDEFTKKIHADNRTVNNSYYLITVTFENKETGQRRIKKYVTDKEARFEYYFSDKFKRTQTILNKDEYIVSIDNLQGLTRDRLCSLLTVTEMSEHFHEFSKFKRYFI